MCSLSVLEMHCWSVCSITYRRERQWSPKLFRVYVKYWASVSRFWHSSQCEKHPWNTHCLAEPSQHSTYPQHLHSTDTSQTIIQDSASMRTLGEPGVRIRFSAARWGHYELILWLQHNQQQLQQINTHTLICGDVSYKSVHQQICGRRRLSTSQQWRPYSRNYHAYRSCWLKRTCRGAPDPVGRSECRKGRSSNPASRGGDPTFNRIGWWLARIKYWIKTDWES